MNNRRNLSYHAFSLAETLIIIIVLAVALCASTPFITRKIVNIADPNKSFGSNYNGRYEIYMQEFLCPNGTSLDNRSEVKTKCFKKTKSKKTDGNYITIYRKLDDLEYIKSRGKAPVVKHEDNVIKKSTIYVELAKISPEKNSDGTITKGIDKALNLEYIKSDRYIFEETNVTYTNLNTDPEQRIIEGNLVEFCKKGTCSRIPIYHETGKRIAQQDDDKNYFIVEETECCDLPRVDIPWINKCHGKNCKDEEIEENEDGEIEVPKLPEDARSITFHAVGGGGAGGSFEKDKVFLENPIRPNTLTPEQKTLIKKRLNAAFKEAIERKYPLLPAKAKQYVDSANLKSGRDVVVFYDSSLQDESKQEALNIDTNPGNALNTDDNNPAASKWILVNLKDGTITVKVDIRYGVVFPHELLRYTDILGSSSQPSIKYDMPEWFNIHTIGGPDGTGIFKMGMYGCGGKGRSGTSFPTILVSGLPSGYDYGSAGGGESTSSGDGGKVGGPSKWLAPPLHDIDADSVYHSGALFAAHCVICNYEPQQRGTCCPCGSRDDDGECTCSAPYFACILSAQVRQHPAYDGSCPGVNGGFCDSGSCGPMQIGSRTGEDCHTSYSAGQAGQRVCGWLAVDLDKINGNDVKTYVENGNDKRGSQFGIGNFFSGLTGSVGCGGWGKDRIIEAFFGTISQIMKLRGSQDGQYPHGGNGGLVCSGNYEAAQDIDLCDGHATGSNGQNGQATYEPTKSGVSGNKFNTHFYTQAKVGDTPFTPSGEGSQGIGMVYGGNADMGNAKIYNHIYFWTIPYAIDTLAYGDGGDPGEYVKTTRNDIIGDIYVKLGRGGVVTTNSKQGKNGTSTIIKEVREGQTYSSGSKILESKGGMGGGFNHKTDAFDMCFNSVELKKEGVLDKKATPNYFCKDPKGKKYPNWNIDEDGSNNTKGAFCCMGSQATKSTKDIQSTSVRPSIFDDIRTLTNNSTIVGIGLGRGSEGLGSSTFNEELEGTRYGVNASTKVDYSGTPNKIITKLSSPDPQRKDYSNKIIMPSNLNASGGGGAVIIIW